jgi:hypothetical protein
MIHVIKRGAVVAAALGLAVLGSGTAVANPNVSVIGPGPSGNVWGVKCIQDALGLDIDGRYGDDTYQAVKNFQRTHVLQVDGAVGIETGNKLFRYNGKRMLTGCVDYVPSSWSTGDPGLFHYEMAQRYGAVI